MSQIYKIEAELRFNLMPRHIHQPKDCLEIILAEYLNKYVTRLNGILVSFSNLRVLPQIAAITQFSGNLVAVGLADLLVFKPSGKIVVESR